jgi:hypothetical protein
VLEHRQVTGDLSLRHPQSRNQLADAQLAGLEQEQQSQSSGVAARAEDGKVRFQLHG